MALFHTTVVDNHIKALDTIGTASGSVATFDTDRAERLVNLEVAITATQSGSGTPSPSNPRTINGWLNCNLSVNGTTVTISFGQNVYFGNINVLTGKLTITHQAYTYVGDIGESWGKSGNYYYSPISTSYRTSFTVIADRYKGVAPTAYTNLNNFECAMSSEFNYINIRDDSGYATVADFRTWLSNNNLTIVYKYVTPIEIQLDSKQIQTIANSVNNIYADTGDIVDLKFVLSVGKAIS